MALAMPYPPGAALPKTRAFEILRRVAIAIQLLLLLLLIVGRAFGAAGDAHLSHTGALGIAPSTLLSSAS